MGCCNDVYFTLLAGEWVSKSSGRDVAQFSANEIFFCVMGLVFSVRYFVFRYLTKFFWRGIVRIFAVPYGTIYFTVHLLFAAVIVIMCQFGSAAL